MAIGRGMFRLEVVLAFAGMAAVTLLTIADPGPVLFFRHAFGVPRPAGCVPDAGQRARFTP